MEQKYRTPKQLSNTNKNCDKRIINTVPHNNVIPRVAFLHPRRIQIRKKFQISHRKIVFSMRNIFSVGIYFFEDSTWQVRDIKSKGGDYKLFKQWCITWHIWIFRYMYKQVRRVKTVTLELELLSGTVLIIKYKSLV